MKTFLVALVCLIIGAAAGGFMAFGIGTGVGTGLAVGTCATIEAVKEQGLMSEAQFDAVLAAAAAKMAGQGQLPPDTELVNTAAGCAKVMAKVKQAAASSK